MARARTRRGRWCSTRVAHLPDLRGPVKACRRRILPKEPLDIGDRAARLGIRAGARRLLEIAGGQTRDIRAAADPGAFGGAIEVAQELLIHGHKDLRHRLARISQISKRWHRFATDSEVTATRHVANGPASVTHSVARVDPHRAPRSVTSLHAIEDPFTRASAAVRDRERPVGAPGASSGGARRHERAHRARRAASRHGARGAGRGRVRARAPGRRGAAGSAPCAESRPQITKRSPPPPDRPLASPAGGRSASGPKRDGAGTVRQRTAE